MKSIRIRKICVVLLIGVAVFGVIAGSCTFLSAKEDQKGTEVTPGNTEPVSQSAVVTEVVMRQGQMDFVHKKLLQTALTAVFGYLLMLVLVRVINHKVRDIKVRHIARRNVIYFFTLMTTLIIVFLWLQNISSLTIFLSVIGAGLALALQEVVLCIAGWVLILVRRPFEVGDRIELGGVKGDVIDIRLFQTVLCEIGNWVDADQSTGRIVNIPNSAMFKKENYNYTRGFEFIWNEIKVLVTFESDWKRAEEIMLAHASERVKDKEDVVRRKIDAMTSYFMIQYNKFTPIVYVNIKESGVELTLRYLTEARRRRSSQDELTRAILEDFEKEDRVNFAYPTYRIIK
ncbi:MAG: mechanosensitive ion channel family protein [Candidatus Omnitrophota bacterium]